MNRKGLMILLTALFAVMMSLPWLVPHTGFLALFALVPLLCLERVADFGGVRHFWLWHYSAFVLWNAATTFWVCNATVGGGIFAVLANALQMSLIFGIFRLSRKRFGGVLPYILLASLWIAWEHWYYNAEISWPWLVLGNAFARSTRCIQWYEYTGVLGGSLWIWAVNLGVFGLMVSLSDGRFSAWNRKARFSAVAGVAVALVAPLLLSASIYRSYEEKSDCGTLEVGIVQPDFDPYEKFESLTQQEQNTIFLDLVSGLLADRYRADSLTPMVVLAPETFTSDIFIGDYGTSPTWRSFGNFLADYPGVNILYGASTHKVSRTRRPPSILARRYGSGWIESHNSALVQDRSGRTEIFHKSKLVVGTELTPYPKLFTKLDDKLGGVMGRCIGQDRISLLNVCGEAGEKVPLGCAVCYESVYGEYCTGYVREGAQALAVITNDAWWGDTPGYRQHLSYSALRAIELRRDIARCANTGISAFIDQRGDILSESSWWERGTLRSKVNLSGYRTVFSRFGDVTGRACVFLALMLCLLLAVSAFTGKKSGI